MGDEKVELLFIFSIEMFSLCLPSSSSFRELRSTKSEASHETCFICFLPSCWFRRIHNSPSICLVVRFEDLRLFIYVFSCVKNSSLIELPSNFCMWFRADDSFSRDESDSISKSGKFLIKSSSTARPKKYQNCQKKAGWWMNIGNNLILQLRLAERFVHHC